MTTLILPEEIELDEIPSPVEIAAKFPLRKQEQEFIAQSRRSVKNILNGVDRRILLIVGPCSIHDQEASLEYALRLRQLAQTVRDQFFIVMRAYFEKPRTIMGWKGMLYDPDLNGSHRLAKGLWLVRSLLYELTHMQVPIGSELLEMTTAPYYSDLLSWGCIGARTCLSPPHRQLAASLPFPVGFKNTIDGNLDPPIYAIISAQSPHTFLGFNESGQLTRIHTQGNPSCHLILRGGSSGPNYDAISIQKAIVKCRLSRICDRMMIDCSHDNCEKQHEKQIDVFESLIHQIQMGTEQICGIMLESFLKAGSQSLSQPLQYGVSITDPCLDWYSTQQLIEDAAYLLRKTF
jgi:3-deoxy-7-phosphoheptulonate synthase